MLKPALLYKEDLLKSFTKYLYTEDYFLYNGYDCGSVLPNIEPKENLYQFAFVDKHNKPIGFLTYRINSLTDTVCDFGLFSFERGNSIIGIDLFKKLNELIAKHHKVEWCVIEGNPVKKHYDKFCKMNNGNILHMHDTIRDLDGQYRDSYLYEIINQKEKRNGN